MKTGKMVLLALFVTAAAVLAPDTALAQEDKKPQETGTDPRDFANKFMPYYRYTELKNGLQQNELVLFGLIALSPKIAFTYEVPLAYERDIRNTTLNNGDGTCGPGFLPGGGFILPNGLPAEGDCQETGIGDMNFRILAKAGHALGGDWLTGAQFNLPTANNDVLGSETFSIAPMLTYVKDLKSYPAPGAFFALMNFYQTDIFKDDGRADQSLYIGRWFFMLPMSKKYKLYLLPELQPIYDFENDHFSFWIGPEFGKMMGPGNIIYLKPGFGTDPDALAGDRDWSLELGWRIFM